MPARFIMVGGFLGAGKTTALLRIAEAYRNRGLRVGLITNDQSVGLVDTAMLSNHQFPVEEITGGCFCCRFNSLTEAAEKLSSKERPDLFLAEPVGSCTDLAATVSYPLRRMFGNNYHISPLSVLIDPSRAEQILGITTGKTFSSKVIYIYRKQLEEAEVIVINKADTLTPSRIDRLTEALAREFAHARILVVSARANTGIEEWIERLESSELRTSESMEVDYDVYAEGEALLGWVNFTATVSSFTPFDGNQFVLDYLRNLGDALCQIPAEIAHLKMTLTPDSGSDLAVANLVRSGGTPESSHELHELVEIGEVIVNLRAEADPELLRRIAIDRLEAVASGSSIDVEMIHQEAFRPGRPVPTHRDRAG